MHSHPTLALKLCGLVSGYASCMNVMLSFVSVVEILTGTGFLEHSL